MIRPRIPRLFSLSIRRADLVRREVDEEMALHLALRAEQLQHQGLAPSEAWAEAVRRFGGFDPSRHALHDAAQHREVRMRFHERLDALRQDARYAARGIRREPLLTAFVVATFALGIGVNAAMFGVVDRLMLSGPAHVTDANRVMQFHLTHEVPGRGDFTTGDLGWVTYDVLRRGTRAFAGIAAYNVFADDYTLGRGAEARALSVGTATADLFPLLGTRAFLGRFFQPDEDRP
ncbi:MAG TPA: permease prefix domain 1-containing protein, partial [Gemmatimonadaceae bacterium]|nr:permease prefix domain 1-containing protein [Gemmatimonadaceae bacterium]